MIQSKNSIFLLLLCFICQISLAQRDCSEKRFLPKPTGSYCIGTKSFTLQDTTKLQKNKDARIYIKIWYPAKVSESNHQYNKYIEGYDLDEIYTNFKSKGVSKHDIETLSNYLTYSKKGIEVSDKEDEYPVIIFTPGYYFGLSDIYSAYIENLASNGYIVCAITHINQQISVKGNADENNSLHTARSALPFLQWWWADKLNFKDPLKSKNQASMSKYFLRKLKRFDRVLDSWEQSTLFFIDYLKTEKKKGQDDLFLHMNLTEIGAMGQSFGGALSNHMCVTHDCIKAGVNMDCFQFGDVINTYTNKPLMLIESEQQIKWRIGNEFIYKDFNHLEYARIKGGLHFLFTDLPYYNVVLDDQKLDELIGKVDGQNIMEWMNSVILSFFDGSLKNQHKAHLIESIDNKDLLYQKSNKCIYLK